MVYLLWERGKQQQQEFIFTLKILQDTKLQMKENFTD